MVDKRELADRFIPPEILRGPVDLARRARLAVALSWLSAGFFGIAAVSQTAAHNPWAAVFDVCLALVTLAGPFLLGRMGLVALTHLVLSFVFIGVVSLSLLVRGAGLSGATVMLAVLPLLATLILGARGAAPWLALSLIAGMVVGGLGTAGLISDHLSGPVRLLNDHLMLVVFTVLLFAVATVFENRKDEALRQISALELQRRTAELGELRAQAEAQLAQSEQFASLGRIAAATAHEINNPLAYVTGNLNFVSSSLEKTVDPELHAALKDALEGTQRIQRIVRDMGLVAQPADDLISSVVVADAITVALSLAEPHTASRAKVQTKLDKVPPVAANEARLTQVLLNLLLNAARAVPEGKPGEHQIAVEVFARDARVWVEIRNPGKGADTRGFGDGGGLAYILGEAVIRSFGGTLVLVGTADSTVARLTLVPSGPVA